MVVWFINKEGLITSGELLSEKINSKSNIVMPFFNKSGQLIITTPVFSSKIEARQYLETIGKK